MYITIITKKRFAVKQLLLPVATYIYKDTHSLDDYNRLCSLNIQQSLKKIVYTLSLLAMASLAMFIGPFYAYVKYGQLTTITSLKIPFIEPFSRLEFLVNNGFQLIICVVGLPGNIGVEGLFALLMDSTAALTECIQWKCSKFSKKLGAGQFTSKQKKEQFIKILAMIQTTDRYFRYSNILNGKNASLRLMC